MYEGYKNNYFQPTTPAVPKRTRNNGIVKGSPQTCDRLQGQGHHHCQESSEDPSRPFIDIIREADNVGNRRGSTGNFLNTPGPFHSASKDSPQPSTHGYNSIHISFKTPSQVNGLTHKVYRKTSSTSELTSALKSDTNSNVNKACDSNSEPNDNCYETDTLLVRCGSMGQTTKKLHNSLCKVKTQTPNISSPTGNGREELLTYSPLEDNRTAGTTFVAMDSVL